MGENDGKPMAGDFVKEAQLNDGTPMVGVCVTDPYFNVARH